MNGKRGKAHGWQAAAAAALVLAASTAGAAVLTEDFDAIPDGNLAGQNSWTSYAAGTSTVQVASKAINMATSATGSSLEIVRKNLGQTFNTAGTSIYYGLDINVSAATSGGDWVAGFSTSGGNYGAKLYAKSSGTGGYLLGWYVGSGSTNVQYGTTSLDFNTPVRVVLRYDFVSGATNDTGAIYVIPGNATDVSSDTPYVYLSTGTFTGQTDLSGVYAMNFHRGGSNGPTMTIDNLAVGAWGDVSAVPEPTVAYLLGLSGLTLLRVRSRRS